MRLAVDRPAGICIPPRCLALHLRETREWVVPSRSYWVRGVSVRRMSSSSGHSLAVPVRVGLVAFPERFHDPNGLITI